VTILNSAITSNTAIDGFGGAVRNFDARLAIANSTLSNNSATDNPGGEAGGIGGAIRATGTVSYLALITNTTIYSNFAAIAGGGVHMDSETGGGGLVKNSIIANNSIGSGPNNCTPNLNLVSAGHNLSSDSSCNFTIGGDLQNTNPRLGPLADNGGGTLTHAPLPGSPVINAADNTTCAAAPVSNLDQRGVSRPQGTTCDMGAVEAAASLSLIKSSTNQGGDPLQPTERLTYTIRVTNTSSLTVTNALVSDTLPANTTFVPGSISLTPPGAGTEGSEPPSLASDLTVNPSQAVTVTFAVTVNSPLLDQTVLTNTASVTSAETAGPVGDTITDTVTNPVRLSIGKSSQDANGGTLIPGDTLTYTIAVTNSGTADATNAAISDILPANTTFVPGSISLTPSGAGTEGSEPPSLASDLTISPSQAVTVAFAVTVNLPLPNQTVLTNTASVTSAETVGSISATISDTVTSFPILNIQKSFQDANGGALVPGDTLTYTIVVTNSGTANATGAVISDTLPANTTFVPGSISLTPPGAGTRGTTPPTLASNLSITLSQPVTAAFAVTANKPLDAGTIITNIASVTSAQVPTPSTDSVTSTVSTTPAVNVVKAGPSTALPDDTVVYTFTLTNVGNTPLLNVQVVDDYAGVPILVSGDDGDSQLELAEVWVYTAAYTIQASDPNPLINTVSVSAKDAANTQATDTDQHATQVSVFIYMPTILKSVRP
jgi:uncharacterized repeat protein (TIGR01451 family)